MKKGQIEEIPEKEAERLLTKGDGGYAVYKPAKEEKQSKEKKKEKKEKQKEGKGQGED